MRVHLEEFICARRQWFIYDHPRHTHTSIGIWEMKSWIALVHLMLWGTCALLCSTVFVACHRWINHMSDKASKGLALFTIVLKYAQICLKPRKGATSGADTKSLTSTFTKNEGIDLWLEHLNWNNLCHMIVYSPSTVSSLNISLQNMKALWVKLKIWCTNFVHLIFPWICDAFFVWEHSLLCQYLCTFPLEIESNAYLIHDVKSSQTYKIGRICCNHGLTTVRGLVHTHDFSLET